MDRQPVYYRCPECRTPAPIWTCSNSCPACGADIYAATAEPVRHEGQLSRLGYRKCWGCATENSLVWVSGQPDKWLFICKDCFDKQEREQEEREQEKGGP